jgi:hypothetical protein
MLFDAHLTAYPVPDSIDLVSALSAARRFRRPSAIPGRHRTVRPERITQPAELARDRQLGRDLVVARGPGSTAEHRGPSRPRPSCGGTADRAHVLVRLGGQQLGLRRLRPWPVPRRAAGRADHQEPAGFPPAGPPVDRLPGREIGRQRPPLQVTGIAPRAGHAPPQAARTAGWRDPESSIPALTGPSRLKSKGSQGAGSRGGAGEEGLRQAWSGKRG